ncbi:putative intracellular multiplication protein IcmT [Piscirickettsia salmonis]|uniref:Type IV secretion system protein IcmT n=1 Tax=Piscirickettsia salmonis TaxID=1238 RepID=A0A1L6TEH0_PISSA|nr:IcmT/TraK family protein [Piscirickettsia salmonis]ALT18673.1 type IV secretion protein IcmT [Piscirickettsia salmonis LF-89 = ATCC VR-1361]ALB23855.1 type IV secretion system protein IcmT [Piscirickettsia salmonis]ALY03694.1 type IV secretion protein IcmT [Piscirickettsia salmonis]AMA43257.1 type IV secretion protein IcmT [Piscirickettsia salmonis]AOS35727.1 type IV secretion protein IcmT [Piscirickettsia salmonis]
MNTGVHWRDSARHPKLYIIDARACFPIVLFIFHMKFSTFIIAILSVIFLSILRKFDLNIKSFFIVIREVIASRVKKRF